MLQGRVLRAIELLPSSVVGKNRALQELNFRLYNINDLYNNFAQPFELYDCSILLMNSSLNPHPKALRTLWRTFIMKGDSLFYILSHLTNLLLLVAEKAWEREPHRVLPNQVLQKVKELGRELHGASPHSFPLKTIISEIEAISRFKATKIEEQFGEQATKGKENVRMIIR